MKTVDGTDGTDPIIGALGQLTADPPGGLADRIVDRWTRLPSIVGDLYVAFTDRGISYTLTAQAVDAGGEDFPEACRRRFGRPLLPAERPPPGLVPALRHGRAQSLRFDLRGLSDFERDVLTATLRIPRGQIRPYAWVASQTGRSRAARAVGSALGRNPVPVLIPCHRVTRSDGRTGDYVLGTATKEALLRAEGVDLDMIRELASAHVFYLGSDTTGIVCFPTCPHARRITAPHRKGFRSVAQARRAGYRPCWSCRPGWPDPPRALDTRPARRG